MAKSVLITSDAHNGYDNVGLLDIVTKKIDWLTDEKWELECRQFLAGRQIAHLDGQY